MVGFTSQVVAGTVFQVKIRVAEGETGCVHVRIMRPLPHTGQDPEIQAWEVDRTESSPFTFGQTDVEMKDESQPQTMSISSMVNQQEVTMLQDMGFSKDVAEKALFLVQGGGVPKAMEWIEAHMDDADFQEPLVIVGQAESKPKSTLTPEEKLAKAKELQERARAIRAKKEAENAKESEEIRKRMDKEIAAAKKQAEE